MDIRQPAVAGQFYGGTRQECLAEIEQCLPAGPLSGDLPQPIVAAIVPHAGWVFSGALAALVFEAIRQQNDRVDTFVLFGAVHRFPTNMPCVYVRGAWQTPLGRVDIDEELANFIAGCEYADADNRAHLGEHSIEVQVPFIQHLFPDARIVPVLAPPSTQSIQLGQVVGRNLADQSDKKVVCIASTDLTHYGPRYGFAPKGTGPVALEWAKDVNDKEFIDQALALDAERVLLTAAETASACGAGAVAAVVETARALGRSDGVLMAHTHSNDVMKDRFGRSSEESVGYAAIVY